MLAGGNGQAQGGLSAIFAFTRGMFASYPKALYFAPGTMRQLSQILAFILRGYQLLISPLLRALAGPGWGCRFEPTCSQYAAEALRMYGVGRGVLMSIQRLCKCHPWGGCGYDPVPRPRCGQCDNFHSNGS